MKGGKVFWGTFFLFVGAVLLLHNFHLTHFNWHFTLKLWPLILVLWGVSKFTEHRTIRLVLMAIAGLVFGSVVVGLLSGDWYDRDWDYEPNGRYSQTLSEPLPPGLQRATFRLEAGAGKYKIEATTDRLVEAATELSHGRYNLHVDRSEGTEDVSLEMRSRGWNWHWGNFRNRADIRLNSGPMWDLRFDVGASSLDLDLSPYKLSELRINAGASTMDIRFGDKSDDLKASVHAGVSKIVIRVPSTAGCEIRDRARLSRRSYDDFERVSEGQFRTSNFDSASKKISIDVEAGVSSIRVDRY